MRDQGRTLRFGGYTSSGDGPGIYPDTKAGTTGRDLAEGIYRLRQGQYQRVGKWEPGGARHKKEPGS